MRFAPMILLTFISMINAVRFTLNIIQQVQNLGIQRDLICFMNVILLKVCRQILIKFPTFR